MTNSRWQQKILSIAPFFVFAAVLLFLYRNLAISHTWAFSDLEPIPLPKTLYEWTFFIWRSEGLGALRSQQFQGYLLRLSLCEIFGPNAAQKVVFLSLPFVAFSSFYYFARQFRFGRQVAFVSSLVYAVNPIVIAEFITGSLSFTVYAGMPLILITLYRIVMSRRSVRNWAILVVLTMLFAGNVHVTFWYILVLLPMLLAAKVVWGTKAAKFGRLVVPLSLSVLLLIAGLSYYFLVAFGGNGDLGTGKGIRDATYTYQDISIPNLLRMSGNKGSAQASEFLDYNSLNAYTLLAYLVPFVGIFALFRRRWDKRLMFLTLSASLGLVLSVGVALTIKANPGLVDLNPLLLSLRNPVKVLYPLAFSLGVLFLVGSSTLLRMVRGGVTRQAICIVFSFLVLLSNFPALDGTLGLRHVRGDGYIVPERYSALTTILKEGGYNPSEGFRVLFLPWEYPLQLRIRNIVPRYLGYFGGNSGSKGNPLAELLRCIAADGENKARILSTMGVKYIVVDRLYESPFRKWPWYETLWKTGVPFAFPESNPQWLGGDPEHLYKMLKADSHFTLVSDESGFAVFLNPMAESKFEILPFESARLGMAPPYDSRRSTIGPGEQESIGELLKFEEIDPTKYEVTVKVYSPAMLSFCEAYNPLWEASIRTPDGEIKKYEPVPLYGMINGFAVDETGEYTVTISFRAQNWFRWLTIISISLFLAACGYLIWDWRKRWTRSR